MTNRKLTAQFSKYGHQEIVDSICDAYEISEHMYEKVFKDGFQFEDFFAAFQKREQIMEIIADFPTFKLQLRDLDSDEGNLVIAQIAQRLNKDYTKAREITTKVTEVLGRVYQAYISAKELVVLVNLKKA